ncbi:UNVERIFIED_CONTAM: cytoskeletal protein CcmA (bactofilin family) [Acetivibrio alkalicellulosi]
MFNKSEVKSPDKFDTLIGINTSFEGNVETKGTIRIDGKVKGEVRVEGDVYIGKDAVITGNLYAKDVYLSGKVEGNIESKGMLKALPTAKIYGDILVQNLITSEGSIFEGKCKMTSSHSNQSGNKNESKKTQDDKTQSNSKK